jgi:pyruvate dehydrogenase E1 component
MAATIPNCVSYDPTYGHELAVIIQDGLKRMVERQENVFYYITLMNENYAHPGLTAGQEQGILRGMYRLKSHQEAAQNTTLPRAQLLGCGTILREVLAAAELLLNDWQIAADIWSVTSFTELQRDGTDTERWNLLHPTEPQKTAFITTQLSDTQGPIIASTDYMRTFAEQIRAFMPSNRHYKVLGTDGFGRSDTREMLRHHFEVDRHFVVLATLKALADEGTIPTATVATAIAKYGIDVNKPNPLFA